MTKALRVLSEIMQNRVMTQAIMNIEIEVRHGSALHEAFEKQDCLDPVITEILEVGEKTGNLYEVLEKLGNQYELEVDAQLKNLSTIIEPLVVLVVGGAVVFMAMAIMMPIFQLQELFSASA